MIGREQERSARNVKRLTLWLALALGILAVFLAAVRTVDQENISPSTGGRAAITNQSVVSAFARSANDRKLLFSKTSSGDLWLRDAAGRERWLASNVVRATFSPDGTKLAYSTRDDGLFIESTDGKRIAQLPRARDYTWSADSAAVTFSAIAAVDYPEFEQIVVYDIRSNQTRFLPLER